MLKFGVYSSLKDYWVEKIDDGELPKCVHCGIDTRNWGGECWSCIKCVKQGITTWVSKPCGPCGCPNWDHGGVGGCYGNPDKPCDGCAGFIPDESADDIICSQDWYDKTTEGRARQAKAWKDSL